MASLEGEGVRRRARGQHDPGEAGGVLGGVVLEGRPPPGRKGHRFQLKI